MYSLTPRVIAASVSQGEVRVWFGNFTRDDKQAFALTITVYHGITSDYVEKKIIELLEGSYKADYNDYCKGAFSIAWYGSLPNNKWDQYKGKQEFKHWIRNGNAFKTISVFKIESRRL